MVIRAQWGAVLPQVVTTASRGTYVQWDTHQAGYSIQNDLQLASSGTLPSISSVSPGPVTEGQRAQGLTVYGSGFASGAQVKLAWPAVGIVPAGNTTLPANFLSTSQLQVSGIKFGNDPSSWTAQVINPGPVPSPTFSFNVQAPVPVITGLLPSSATAGGAAFTLTVNGTTFDQGSVVRWNGANLTTTPTVNSGLTTALTAQVPANDIAVAGTATVTVYNPGPGGGASSGAVFAINSGGPTITGVSPSPVTGANSAQGLTLYGSGFVGGAQVKLAWPAVGIVPAGNTTLPANFLGSSQLQVSGIKFGNDPSAWAAQVINPGPVSSPTFSFNVQAPVPVITGLLPSSATAGGAAFTLTVNGTTFDQGSVVRWNGANLTTTPTVNSGLTTALTAQVPANDIAVAATATVTVYSPGPGGGASSGAAFAINSGGHDHNRRFAQSSDRGEQRPRPHCVWLWICGWRASEAGLAGGGHRARWQHDLARQLSRQLAAPGQRHQVRQRPVGLDSAGHQPRPCPIPDVFV